MDCGASQGQERFETVRPPASGTTPRACLAQQFERCAPAFMEHDESKRQLQLRGRVVPTPAGCTLEWSARDARGPQQATCKALETVHRVPPGQAQGQADPATDRLLAKDCSDGGVHLL